MSTTTGPLDMPHGGSVPTGSIAYAGFGRRLLAVILDSIILSIPERHEKSKAQALTSLGTALAQAGVKYG